MNADRGIPRGSAALHTPAGYARRSLQRSELFQLAGQAGTGYNHICV